MFIPYWIWGRGKCLTFRLPSSGTSGSEAHKDPFKCWQFPRSWGNKDEYSLHPDYDVVCGKESFLLDCCRLGCNLNYWAPCQQCQKGGRQEKGMDQSRKEWGQERAKGKQEERIQQHSMHSLQKSLTHLNWALSRAWQRWNLNFQKLL